MKSFLKLIICSIIIKSTSEFISTNLACDPLKTTGLVVLKGNCFADSKTAHFQNCHLQCLTGTFEDTSHSSRTLKCINGQWFEGSFALPSSYELTCNQNRDVIAYKTKIKSFFSGLRPLFQCPALTIGASVEVLDHGCNPNENESCVLFCQNGGFSNPEIKNQHSIVINCNKELGMLFYVLYKSLNFQLLSFTPKCYLNDTCPVIDSKDPSVSFSHGCNRGEKVKNSNECTIQCPSAQPPAITSATIVCENGVWVDKHDSINVYHNTDDLKVPFIACPLSETLYIFNSCQYIQYSAESYDIDFCSYYQSEEINSVYCLYKCKKGFVLANEPKKRHVGANNSVFGVIYCIANAFEEPACQPFEHVNTCSPLVSKNVELVNCEMDGGLRCEVYCPLGSFEGLDKDRVNVLCHEGVWRQEQAKGMFLVIRSAGNVFVCKDRKEILTIEQENVAEVGGEYAKEKCQFWCLKGYFAYPPDFSQDFYTGGVAKYGEKKECLRWTEWLVKMQKEYVFREDKI